MSTGDGLHAAPSLDAADWLIDEGGKMGYRVSSLIPEGFDAYVRILHPADGEMLESGEPRRIAWRQVAEAHGKEIHPEVDWEDLVGHLHGDGESGEPWPDIGSLPEREHRRLAGIAAGHTSSDRYWLAWWEGFGYGPRESRPLRRRRWYADRFKERLLKLLLSRFYRHWRWSGEEMVHVARRDRRGRRLGDESPSQPAYLPEGTPLFDRRGRRYGLVYSSDPLAAASYEERPIGISPQLWWPDDRSWIVATEIDLVSTYVACSRPLAEDLMADDQLEAIRVELDHSVCLDRSWWDDQ
ncbi:MAG: hypothetical protein F4126_03545 [Acidimicrobiaceae bacterium]|nr:hypothetical protein [Acidimicrobiaceae bacterium]MXZ53173.1 hypothetical protein [Acidimicrobiaceae bacterium]MYB87894.1 hypothetical protein [Acidimicrobiaceae bacterium]MYH92767.1 hypothetical protein [Acidimicrobiaceae bacterium]